MTTPPCGASYEYGPQKCARPQHDDLVDAVHDDGAGLRWIHHEETYAEGTPDEGVETWDEPEES